MSAEPPPLPDESDPFKLLGVPRDVDKRELKRAYGRMVRRYRPDRHPEEFRKVRAAYEEALESLEFSATLPFGEGFEGLNAPGLKFSMDGETLNIEWTDPSGTTADIEVTATPLDELEASNSEADSEAESESGSESGSASESGDSVFTESPAPTVLAKLADLGLDLKQALADGTLPVLHAQVSDRSREQPVELEACQARFLLEDLMGVPITERMSWLKPAMLADIRVLDWFVTVTSDAENRRLAASDDYSWSFLSRWPLSFVAETFFDYRCRQFLEAGNWSGLKADLLSPDYVKAASSRAELRHVALRVACAAIWSPEQADFGAQLFSKFQEGTALSGGLEEAFEERQFLRSSWRRWMLTRPGPPELVAFMSDFHCLDYDSVLERASALSQVAQQHPQDLMEGLEQLGEVDVELQLFMDQCCQSLFSGLPEPGDPEQVLNELRLIEEALASSFLNNLLNASFVLLLAGLPFACYLLSPSLVFCYMVLIGLLFRLSVIRGDRRLYKRVLRPRFVAMLGSQRTTMIQVASLLKQHEDSLTELSRFDDELEGDIPLHLFALAHHLNWDD